MGFKILKNSIVATYLMVEGFTAKLLKENLQKLPKLHRLLHDWQPVHSNHF